MKKILLVVPLSTIAWGEKNAGGVDSVCQLIIQSLAGRKNSNYYYRVLAFDPFSAGSYSEKPERISPFVEIIFAPMNERRCGIKIPGLLSQLLHVRKHLKLFNPDIVHSHSASWIIGVNKKIKRIATLHGYKWIGRKPVSLANDFLYTKLLPPLSNFFVDQYTCVGDAVSRALAKSTKKPIQTINNPLDDAYFLRTEQYARDKSGINLVTCALISRKKRIDRAITLTRELLSKGHNATLTIVGPNNDKKYFSELTNLIEKLGINDSIRFTGSLNRIQIVNEYSSANIGLFFSEEETFGLAPLEMLASGLPLATTEVGILAEKKEAFERLGVKYLTNSIEDQINSINSLLENPPNPKSDWLKYSFSSSSVVANYELLYTKILKKTP